ncbi:MAG: DNA topology modulation protein FlaR, partial [Eubacterium sp.]|nr:DNA topology modulation protein FlaR [Eubacterium sp.]
MKIAIMGFSGSGKSTLAKQLSDIYNTPLLYLDCVNFEENWVERDRAECKKMVYAFMQNDSWVIDGNYSEMYQAERLEQADKIIILCYNRFVCMKGAFKRNHDYKGKVRESMAEGCKERMDFWFFTWVVFKQYSRKRKNNVKSIKNKYPDKTVIFKNRKQLNA